jgi:hypothetical protein
MAWHDTQHRRAPPHDKSSILIIVASAANSSSRLFGSLRAECGTQRCPMLAVRPPPQLTAEQQRMRQRCVVACMHTARCDPRIQMMHVTRS